MHKDHCSDLSAYLDKCIQDSKEAFFKDKKDYKPGNLIYPVLEHDLSVHMWPQTWANTSCGFGGISGQAFTTSYLVVIEYYDRYRVYNGRFAFQLERPNKKFMEQFVQRNIRSMNRGVYEEVIE